MGWYHDCKKSGVGRRKHEGLDLADCKAARRRRTDTKHIVCMYGSNCVPNTSVCTYLSYSYGMYVHTQSNISYIHIATHNM